MTPFVALCLLLSSVCYVSVVEYKIADMGFLRYYLAPKIEDQDAD